MCSISWYFATCLFVVQVVGWLRFPGAGRRPRRQARDTMADRWSYASNASWVPGENIPALHAGGVNGGHSLNAAGMQLFGNCVSNLERLPMKTLKELYSTLTGHITGVHSVDAVSVAAVLGGCTEKLRDDGIRI